MYVVDSCFFLSYTALNKTSCCYVLLNAFEEKGKHSFAVNRISSLFPSNACLILFYSWPVSYLHHKFRRIKSSLIVLPSFIKLFVNMENVIESKGRHYVGQNWTLYKNLTPKSIVKKKHAQINKYFGINVLYPDKKFIRNR